MNTPKRNPVHVAFFLFLVIPPFQVFSIQPSFYLSQSLDQAGNYGLSTSLVTGYLDTRISIKEGELYSWSLVSEPVQGLRIFAGSLAFSGVPARARNPIFPVSSALYAPVGVMTGKVLNYGTTKDTGRVGVDCSFGLWRVVSFASPEGLAAGPAWLQVSRVLVFKCPSTTLVRFSVFGGLHRQAPNDDSGWFRRDEYIPATDIATPGIEIVATRGGFSTSVIGFSSLSRLRKPAGAFAADASFASKLFSLAGGIYSADYTFTDLDGDEAEVLRRMFVAPTLRIPFETDAGTEFTLGGMFYADTRRNPSIRETMPMVFSGGAEISFQNRSFYGNIRAKRTDEGADFSCSTNFRKFIADWLQWQLKGKTSALLDNRETPDLADSEITSRITIRGGKILSAGFGISANFPGSGHNPVLSGDVTAALSLKASNSLWKLAFSMAKTADETPATMKLSLATTVK